MIICDGFDVIAGAFQAVHTQVIHPLSDERLVRRDDTFVAVGCSKKLHLGVACCLGESVPYGRQDRVVQAIFDFINEHCTSRRIGHGEQYGEQTARAFPHHGDRHHTANTDVAMDNGYIACHQHRETPETRFQQSKRRHDLILAPYLFKFAEAPRIFLRKARPRWQKDANWSRGKTSLSDAHILHRQGYP